MGKFTAFKLPLKSLGEGIHEFCYKIDRQFFVNMENADVRDADIDARLVVDHHNGSYRLAFSVTGTVTLLCDRCLDDLVQPIDATYGITVEYGDDYNDESDELLVIPHSENSLNVAYMLYDTVVLAIPIKHVHPLGKCNRAMSALLKKHRAQSDGEESGLDDRLPDSNGSMDGDAPVDPRWDALRGLASDTASEGD